MNCASMVRNLDKALSHRLDGSHLTVYANQGGAQFEGDFSDFFNSIFGGRGQAGQSSGFQQRNARGQDIEIELPVFLEETLEENQKTVEFEMPADAFSQTPPSKKSLKVKIPQGVLDGARIRLKGQGKLGHNGGTAGDLYLHIRVVPHPLFEVSGTNITDYCSTSAVGSRAGK